MGSSDEIGNRGSGKTRLKATLRARRRRKKFWRLDSDDLKRMAFYEPLIGPGDLAFDGANRGNRAKVFLKLGAKVVAFEPQRACADHLESVLGRELNFDLVRKAVGAEVDETEMLTSEVDGLSSLSPHWVKATQESGRFTGVKWNERQRVEITTLDAAIREHGVPRFIKIDVEGYESEVLAGLSQPIDCLSVEFTPEYMENTHECIDRMASLSRVQCPISIGESMVYALPRWVSPEEMKAIASRVGPAEYGDVYIRCSGSGS